MIALAAASQIKGNAFVASAYRNCIIANIAAKLLSSTSDIKQTFADDVPIGTFGGRYGYRNPIGGWAEAARAVDVGITRIRQMGGTVRAGAEVVGLKKSPGDERKVEAVVLANGEEVQADVIVVGWPL